RRDGLHLAVRDVDQRVVERHLAAGVEDLTGEAGGPAAAAGHLRALEADAGRAGVRGRRRTAAIRDRRNRRADRGAGVLDADLLQATVDGAGAARRRADVVLAAARAAGTVPVGRAVIAHGRTGGFDAAATGIAIARARALWKRRAHPGNAGRARRAVGFLRALLVDLAGTTGNDEHCDEDTGDSRGNKDRRRPAVHGTSMSCLRLQRNPVNT